MPARTNEFQELVSLIQKSLMREGESVEDSAMVSVEGIEGEREIDILITSSVGSTKVKVAVEAKDEGRPLDVLTIEALAGKYNGAGSVQVDKVVVVSRSGFTSTAKAKAKLLGMTLLTLDEARDLNWEKVAPEHVAFRDMKTIQFKIPPHLHDIRVVPPFPAELEKQIVQHGKLRCPKCKDGKDHGSFLRFVIRSFLERNDRLGRETIERLHQECMRQKKDVWGEISSPIERPMFVRYEGVDYPIQEIRAKIHAANALVPLECKSYQLDDSAGESQLVHHMSFDIGETKFRWVMPQGLKSKKIAVKIERPKNPKELAERRKQKAKLKKRKQSE